MTTLMKKPLLMKKVQAEIVQLARNEDLIYEQDVEKLSYLRTTVKETLTLYLPSPLLLSRETIKKCKINDCVIEGGNMVYMNAWAIVRDSTKWENTDEFLPERFLETKLDLRGQNPKVIPFVFRRKRCPGIGMAMSKIEFALANVVYKFKWKLPPGIQKEDNDFNFVLRLAMHKKNAIHLVLKLVFS